VRIVQSSTAYFERRFDRLDGLLQHMPLFPLRFWKQIVHTVRSKDEISIICLLGPSFLIVTRNHECFTLSG